jgi:predicted DsbA family dithiol-disulfide isomerase
VRIDIWSDVVCPWCYIGKKRFDRAIAQLESASLQSDAAATANPFETGRIEIVYRAYQLDPTAPVGQPTPVRDVYARKFGGPERAEAIFEQMTATAANEGVQFDFPRAVRANTIRSHRLLWWTQHQYGNAAQATLKEGLMAGYFTHGQDLGDVDTLIDIGLSSLRTFTSSHPDAPELTAESLRSFLLSDLGEDDVRRDIEEAAANGITGVPTYVIDGQWAIPGAQDTETFERVLRRALDRRSTEGN